MTNKIVIKDYDGEVVTNVRLDLLIAKKGYKRAFVFHPKKNENNEFLLNTFIDNLRTGTKKKYSIGENYRILVSAQGFRLTERTIKFERCKGQTMEIVLEKIKQDIKLIGIIYDSNGAIVPSVKITAKSERERTFFTTSKTDNYTSIISTSSNNEGSYKLRLYPGEYELTFEASGFKKFIISKFTLVNSTNGKMNLDIVLEIDNSNCGVGGICP